MNRRIDQLYQEGTIAIADGNLSRGKKLVDKIMALDPLSPMSIELAGDFARASGEIDEALGWYERLTAENFSNEWRGIGFMNIASIHQADRAWDKAIDYFQKALQEFLQLQDQERAWYAKQTIGEVLLECGRFQQSADTLEKLLDEMRAHPKRRRFLDDSLDVRRVLAEAYRFIGRMDDSRYQWEKIESIARKQQNPIQLAVALDGLGVLCQIQGQYEQAEELHLESLKLNRNLRDLDGQSVNLGNLARLYIHLKDWDQAEDYVRKSLKIELKHENLSGISFNKLLLAEIDIGREKYKDAEKKLLQLESLMSRQGETDDLLAISSKIGFVYRMMGRLDEARERQLRVLEEARRMNHADGIPSTLDELAEIELTLGNKQQAKVYWQEALELFEQIGSEKMSQQVRSSLDDLE
jgi:tetratricopeptide (TPR) repeat protein